MTLLHIFIKISNDTFSFFTIVANIKPNNESIIKNNLDFNLFHLIQNFIDFRYKIRTS